MSFKDLVSSLRAEHQLSLSDFAGGINAYLPPSEAYSRMQVCNWENGRFTPPITKLDYIRQRAIVGTWQHTFASQGIQLLSPDQEPISNVSGNGNSKNL